ncbi:MAG: hypothetical protein FOGNACKC_02861 [Anaerolineae bacterium]|nr:hypothetical protein [Anaerolineae bacterium]
MSWSRMAVLLFVISILTAACQPSPPAPLPTYTPNPTYTPYPTYTPPPSPQQSRLPSAQIDDLVWPAGPRDDVIPVEDAAAFLNETVTVEGTVSRTHNSGSAVFLNFDGSGRQLFTAVIFPDDWPKFAAPPETLFAGKLVRIDGAITEYNGTPEIIIKSPAQIEVALTLGQPIPVAACNCPPAPTAPPAEPTPGLPATTVTQADSPPPVEPTSGALTWQNAADFNGQVVTIAGEVISTYNSGKVVFLNFDEAYQDTFKVVIFPDAWPLFPEPPEAYFHHKKIKVTGQVKLYQNAPEIVVDQPDQIVIVE